nr:hypothetical protein [Archangium lipolyticum]
MLGELAVAHAHGIDGLEMSLPAGRRHAQEGSLVRSVVRLVGTGNRGCSALLEQVVDHQRSAELLEPAAFGELARFDGREAELLDQAGDLGAASWLISRFQGQASE